jgi:hypothetical protein
MLELQTCSTREFVPDFFEREIRATVNGVCEIPPGVDRSSYRTINLHVCLTGFSVPANVAPFCVLSRSSGHGHEEYARTEVQWYNVNARFIRPFTLCVAAGDPELLFFDIYDVACTSDSLSTQTPLGCAQLDLNSLLASRTHSVSLDVSRHRSPLTLGRLQVAYTDIAAGFCGSLCFRFALADFVSPGPFFRRSAPYFEVSRLCAHSRALIPVFKSAVAPDGRWERVELLLQFLCGGDLDEVVRISFYDFVARGRDHRAGFVDTTVRVLCGQPAFEIHSERGDVVGRLAVAVRAKVARPRFDEYRLRGLQIAPMLAVDFSSSRISFFTTNRVQHIATGVLTYGNLINGVFDNLRHICCNQHWRAYGFADFPQRKLMPLSMNRTQRRMRSVKALMSAYWSFRDRTSYPERAPLAPVFAEARTAAGAIWKEHRAITLVIVLTNGRFCDLQDAIDQIVDAEDEPVIAIVATIGGTGRDVEGAFHPAGGGLRHSDGRTVRREMVNVMSYEKNCLCADHSLETRMVPAIHKMALEWIERVGFE